MLLGVYVLLMRYYDWREWATLLDSRVPNNDDVGAMPMPITPALPARRVCQQKTGPGSCSAFAPRNPR